jgi:hypothetical protein
MIEWNLAFAKDEVVAGVEKLLAKLAYDFSRTESPEEQVFQAVPPQGALTFSIRPLTAYKSPFNIQVTLHRTLLVVTFTGFSPSMEEALRQGLMLTFLRVGG